MAINAIQSVNDVLKNSGGDVIISQLVKDFLNETEREDEYNSMISCAVVEETKKLHELHQMIFYNHPDAVNGNIANMQQEAIIIRNFINIVTAVDEAIDRKCYELGEEGIATINKTMGMIGKYLPIISIDGGKPKFLLSYNSDSFKEYFSIMLRMYQRLYKISKIMH